MISRKKKNPLVICFSGLDPTGGAGISADIESLKLQNCHALPLISCITNQNGHFFKILRVIKIKHVKKQLDAIFEEFSNNNQISTCKIGFVAAQNHKKKTQLHGFIKHLRDKNNRIKIIFDPVIKPSSSQEKIHPFVFFNEIKRNRPFNQNDILTPNRAEFFNIAGMIEPSSNQRMSKNNKNVQSALKNYQKLAINHLIITSINRVKKNNTSMFEHWLCCFNEKNQNWKLTRYYSTVLNSQYHGSGCTFSTLLTSFIAKNIPIKKAAQKAFKITHQTLKHSKIEGISQKYPLRSCLVQKKNYS